MVSGISTQAHRFIEASIPLALRKDIFGHLATQVHKNHVTKHPNDPEGDTESLIVLAD